MAEKLTDQELKAILKVFAFVASNNNLTEYEKGLKEKIIKIVTKQPDPIPYCTCNDPDYNHTFKNPFCNKCYGVPHNWKP